MCKKGANKTKLRHHRDQIRSRVKCQRAARVITFASGAKSTIMTKQFKNEAAMNRWLERHGDEIDLLEVCRVNEVA